ncbi:hypothetical protein GCM10027346_43290 [Hymenobacter seoulensis]
MGKVPADFRPTHIPNCPTCHQSREEVTREMIPEETWNTGLAPLWKAMEAEGHTPQQIAYCPKCQEYGLIGGWGAF